MIETVRETPHGTIYRLRNYDLYSPGDTERDTERDTQRDGSETPARHQRDTSEPRTRTENKPQTTEASASNGEPAVWDARTLRAIGKLYGVRCEGLDQKPWHGQPTGVQLPDPEDHDERAKCIRIAVDRLQGEGRAYQGVQFRRTLLAVIREQHGNEQRKPNDGRSSDGVDDFLGSAGA
jgi:hypothetical protein